MPVDTFIADVGVDPSVGDAEADYQLVKDLHTKGDGQGGEAGDQAVGGRHGRDRTRRQGRRRRPGVTGS
jgi:hypothetical protein